MSENSIGRLGPFTLLAGLLLAATALGLWYSTESPVHADDPAPAADDVLASVGDVQITQADLEAANAAGFLQLRRDRQELLENTLDTVINQKLIDLEAAEQGVTTEQLLEQEVGSKVTEPTDEEIETFYEENKGRIQQAKEAVLPQIRRYLSNQSRQSQYQEYIAGLRAKHGVRSYLEPLRFEVATAGAPAKGPEAAPVTIVEFSDFECPYCSRVVPTLERVHEEYGDKVRLVFRQFPLHSIHPNAQKAAEASLCANDQERFWEMHDTMFQEQKALGVEQLKQKAERVGLEVEAFNECLDSGKYEDQVMADVEAGRNLGVSGTPAMFINGRFMNGAQPFEAIAKVIDDELARLQ